MNKMSDKEDELFFEEAMSGIQKFEKPNKVLENKKTKGSVLKKRSSDEYVGKIFHHRVDLNETADIDKQTMRRFKREEFGVEASLDLHGLTTDKAYEAVRGFIVGVFNQNKRAVLIVTGKGLPHPGQDEFDTKGTLKQQVPLWLKSDELSPMILTFIHPSTKLGGSGALYILMRRKR